MVGISHVLGDFTQSRCCLHTWSLRVQASVLAISVRDLLHLMVRLSGLPACTALNGTFGATPRLQVALSQRVQVPNMLGLSSPKYHAIDLGTRGLKYWVLGPCGDGIYLDNHWLVIPFNQLWATLGCSGLLFWATGLSGYIGPRAMI